MAEIKKKGADAGQQSCVPEQPAAPKPAEDTKRLHDLDVEAYLHDCVSIYPEQIHEEYVRQSADYAYWNERYARALKRFLTSRVNLQRVEARVWMETRAKLLEENAKVTEAMVNNEVAGNEDLRRAMDEKIEAEVEKTRLGGILEAMTHKKEMLVSLGAHVRKEMEGDPSLRERTRNAPGREGD